MYWWVFSDHRGWANPCDINVIGLLCCGVKVLSGGVRRLLKKGKTRTMSHFWWPLPVRDTLNWLDLKKNDLLNLIICFHYLEELVHQGLNVEFLQCEHYYFIKTFMDTSFTDPATGKQQFRIFCFWRKL